LDPDVAPAAHLRHDGEVLGLLQILQLRVGEPATFLLEPLGGPGVISTTRTTTFVVSILPDVDDPD
jgi:hypothetical protein